ncbi:ROK family transcriptional regulator [Bacillus sp. B15-48]|uniref:ROK family transcriptional regulator n=1 Tax=Bacillus sp. B15-48 TaxID=1548601 RepID=UPI00193F385C|nr:ROK family transcriptional regulator [Bacillus sp. B15-48]MBM4764665.1 ROK family protein [Bacillus sp. B15-48]
MATGDSAFIKKINRSMILRKIIEERFISRADLSKITHLTRATISAQVADLIEEGLILETQQEHLSVGRKPIMLSINGEAGYALGIDLDYGEITFTMSNLLGVPVCTETIHTEATEYSEILQLLINQIKTYRESYKHIPYGIVGVTIGIHGLVNKDEVIAFVPRFKWKNIHLKTDLKKEFDLNIYIENNANLSSLAERVYVYHEAENLLSVSLYSGIGLGMMMNSEFFRGNDGFAGEAGHMILVPGGKKCNCGNEGCWERYASETSFFNDLAEEMEQKNLTHRQVQKWIDEGNEKVCTKMDDFIYYLTIGINNLINLYNPDVIVLDSHLLRNNPDVIKKITENLVSSVNHYRELSISKLGVKSCAMGACAFSIKHFLDVPMLNLTYEEESYKNALI